MINAVQSIGMRVGCFSSDSRNDANCEPCSAESAGNANAAESACNGSKDALLAAIYTDVLFSRNLGIAKYVKIIPVRHSNQSLNFAYLILWSVRLSVSSFTMSRSPQSAYPAYVVGTLCIVGGITGFARTRSIPSIVAGVGSVLTLSYKLIS